jgi:hypothetical protein
MNLNINFSQTTPLCEIMTRNRSDKGNTNLSWAWHHYTMFYYQLFKDIKDKQLRVFELGMGTTDPNIDSNMGPNGRPGASLFGWSEFFPNSAIFGADVDKKILFETDRIKTYYCDQTDAECIKKMWAHPELQENFDIIIDDGLHRYFSNECFFENSIHKLKEDGFYIIEDINNKRDLPQLLEIVERWKSVYNQFNFELIKFPSHWNDYDNNIMLITKKREFLEIKSVPVTVSPIINNNDCDNNFLNDSMIISYSTRNYERVTNIYMQSLQNVGINETNIKHKIDNYDISIFNNEGFQSNLWYYAVTNKIHHLIQVLDSYKTSGLNKYFIFSDCDVQFIEKNKHEWNNLQKFIDENENDVFFMRDSAREDVNTGFFIIKNNKNLKYIVSFFKNVLHSLINREKRTMDLGDQTIINELKNNINFDFIPDQYIVFGTKIYDMSKSLVHHSVYCKTNDEKINQMNFIKSTFT